MTTLHTVSFKRTVLATLISLCISRYAFALQEISDDALSQATGEGVAILPTDFSFVLRGDKTGNEISLADRSKDTGYIHYVPVGGLTSLSQDTNKDGLVTSADHSVGKADLYLYGLASKLRVGELQIILGFLKQLQQAMYLILQAVTVQLHI
jgi:hypothetical protein